MTIVTLIDGAAVPNGTQAAPGSIIHGVVNWQVQVTGVQVARVEFRVDADSSHPNGILPVWTERAVPYQFNGDPAGRLDTTKLKEGPHKLGIRVYDPAGTRVASTACWVTVKQTVTPPPPPPPTGEVFFNGDVSTGDLSQWGGAAQEKAPGRCTVQQAVRHLHKYALRFEVRPGDNNVAGSGSGGERCQVMIGQDKSHGYEGSEIWEAYSFLLETPRGTNGGWNTVTDYHSTAPTGGGGPITGAHGTPIWLRVAGADFNNPTAHWYELVHAWDMNRWYEVLVGEFLSSDPAKGWVEAWVDGKQVVARVNVPTLYNGMGIYAKAGHYRVAWTETDVTYVEGFCLATTRAAAIAKAFPGSDRWPA